MSQTLSIIASPDAIIDTKNEVTGYETQDRSMRPIQMWFKQHFFKF